MGKYYSVIGGLIFMVLGLIGLIVWFDLFIKALQASIPALFILGGLISFIAGISEIKDSAASQQEEEKAEEKAEKKEEKKEEAK